MIDANLLDGDTKYCINPTGRFVIGGPYGDSGLTGRKIIVDTYGGIARHGGGAFSGKDPTKVDRSAAYGARWVAKNVVAAGLAHAVRGRSWPTPSASPRPVSVTVETFGTEKVPIEKIEAAIAKVFDLRPAAIIKDLDLRRPIYRQTAAYGHFGRTDLDLPWEHLNKVDALKAAIRSSNRQQRQCRASGTRRPGASGLGRCGYNELAEERCVPPEVQRTGSGSANYKRRSHRPRCGRLSL